MESIVIRREVAKHLALRNKLQVAVKEVKEKGPLSMMDVATKYKLYYQILDRKIYIVKRKEEFYERKRKFDAAREEIIEGNSTYNAASKHYGINLYTLYDVVKKARAQENYEYDRKIRGSTFIYLQEKSLLKILKNWARHESLQNLCACQLCALEQLSTFGYEFSKQNNIKCPSMWNVYKLATIDWLIDFEIRHSDEISNSFDSIEKCLKYKQTSSKLQLLSMFKKTFPNY